MQLLPGNDADSTLQGHASMRHSVAGMLASAPMSNAPASNASAMLVSIDTDQSANHPAGLRNPKEVEIDFDSLYLAMSSGRNRWDATVRMVEWFAKHCPGANVRCGLGGKRLKRFFDARLGWLGAESVLQRALATQWKQIGFLTAESEFAEGQITLRLRRAGYAKIAVLYISGDRVAVSLFERLTQHERVMGAILLGQPVIAFPEWSIMTKRSRWSIMIAGLMLGLLFIFPVPYRSS